MPVRTAPATPATELPRPLAGSRAALFGTLVAVGVTLAALTVAWSLLVGSVVGHLSDPTAAGRGVAATAARLCALALLTAAFVGAERVLAEHLGQLWVNEVRVTVFAHLARTPVRDDHRATGATTLRLVGDMSALQRWAALGLARLAVAVPIVLGCLVALVLAAPAIAAAVAAVVAIGTGATVAFSPRLHETTRLARRRRTRIAAHVTEHVGNRLVMQAFGREAAERRTLRRHGRRLGRAMVRRARMIGLVRAVGEGTALLAAAAALVAALAVGVDAAAAGSALAVIAVLAAALRDLSRVAEYRAAARVAREKLETALRRPVRPLAHSPVGLPAGRGVLEAEDVAVDGVFADVGLRAAPGAVTAVVGPNGSGKSTLLAVLAGLLRPDAGRVLLDGTDLCVLDERQLRAAIGLAGPDLPLLRGTIGDNVRYADPDARDADVAAALRAAGLDEVLDGLPAGLDTRVGEGGAGLSAGQRQRVALARAVLARPRVLLLDEADAHLDPLAAAAVDRLVAGFDGAAVIVTHRMERLRVTDGVYELAGGTLRAAGRPAADRL